MKEFPWWLLLLCFLLLLPVVACPIFLFGGLQAFEANGNKALYALSYVLVQLAWLLPAILSFRSLDLYRRGWHARSVLLATTTLLLATAYILWLLRGI